MTQFTAPKKEKWVQSVCKMCLAGCNVVVRVEDGVVTKVEGDPSSPDNMGKVCGKAQASVMRLYDPNRVKAPLKRTNPEKGPGVDPKWQEISWDEAFEIVGQKLKKIREDDPRKLLCAINDFQRIQIWAWPAAFGSPHFFSTVGHFCGAAYHPICGITDGAFACVNDYEYCNYWIQIGGGDGFTSHLHLSGSQKRMADARVDRGMKVVYVEPHLSAGAAKADEWVPILPGTDRAFVMGMMYAMVFDYGFYDREFLKKHTNAAYLVGEDGNLVRDKKTSKPFLWDIKDNKAKVYDDPTLNDYELEGTFQFEGQKCKTGFQIFKEVLKDHDPEKMSRICDVPASTIRRIAKEFGEAARIGSTIVIEGKEYPYRPAALNFYRGGVSHVDGALTHMAFKHMNMLVGNIDVPGGHIGVALDHTKLWIEPGPDGMLKPQEHMLHPAVEFTYPPNSTQLMEFFPIGVDPGHLNCENILHPETFNFNFTPEAMLIYHSNPMWNIPGTDKVQEVFRRMDFIVAIDVVLNESTEWADIVLPDHTWFESHYLICLEPPEITGHGYRRPVIEPLYNSKDAVDILTEISDRSGCLDIWNDILNFRFGMTDEYKLEHGRKYEVTDILDRYAKSFYGPDHGLEWFKKHGHSVRKLTKEEKYMPWEGLRIPFYYNYIKEVGDKLKEKFKKVGVHWDVSAYMPVAKWRDNPLFKIAPEYDLYAISFKTAILNFSENTTIPWIKDVLERDPHYMGVMINTKTAQKRGIADGDRLLIESPFGKVEGIAKLTEEIHPQVLGFSNAIGRWARHPIERKMGTHFNALLPSDLEFTCKQSGALESATKVKIRKI